MSAAEGVQIAVGVVSVLAALVGIAGALIAVFWRGAKFAEATSAAVIESERRLVDKITESEHRMRAENEKAHDALGANIERLSGDIRQLSGALGSLSSDVAFLSGRHHEGDLRGRGGN